MFTAIAIISLLASSELLNVQDKELPEAAKKELKKFEGKWKPEKLVANGQEEMPPEGDDMLLEFKARKLLVGNVEFFEIIALDPSTDPKILDLKALADMGPLMKDTVYEAIYKFNGENLLIAVHVGSTKKRPDKLESAKDSEVVFVNLKPVKK